MSIVVVDNVCASPYLELCDDPLLFPDLFLGLLAGLTGRNLEMEILQKGFLLPHFLLDGLGSFGQR